MKKAWDYGAVSFDRSGMFSRIGDYVSGPLEGELPFSAQIDGIGSFKVPIVKEKKNRVEMDFADVKNIVSVSVTVEFDEETRILSRRDTVRNLTKKTLMIRKWLGRFLFNCGDYEVMASR